MRGLVPALRFVTQLVKDRLILREEHGFVQGAISLQGLHGVLEERWHEVGAILRNFEIEKQDRARLSWPNRWTNSVNVRIGTRCPACS